MVVNLWQITVEMVAIESVTYIVGCLDIFMYGIRGKHLDNVEYQV